MGLKHQKNGISSRNDGFRAEYVGEGWWLIDYWALCYELTYYKKMGWFIEGVKAFNRVSLACGCGMFAPFGGD